MTKSIVARVDGSAGALAAALARRQQTTLTLVHVFQSLFTGYGPMHAAGDYAAAEGQLRAAAQASLQADAAGIRTAYPQPRPAGATG